MSAVTNSGAVGFQEKFCWQWKNKKKYSYTDWQTDRQQLPI